MKIVLALCSIFLSQIVLANPTINTIADNKNYLHIYSNTLPIVDINLTIKRGSANDGDMPGLTNLMLNVLMSSDIDNKKLVSYFENLGAKLSYSVGKESLSLTIRSVSNLNQISELTKLLNKALMTNYIDSSVFNLEKEKVLTAISESKKRPGSLLDLSISENLFLDTALAHQPYGRKESVTKIQIEDVLLHRDRMLNLNDVEINIVGDIQENDSRKIINALTNRFVTKENINSDEFYINKVIHHTEFDSSQSHIAVIIPSISRTHLDYHNLLVANYIFGGSGFGSWLMDEIRQKRGLSYSVFSYLSTYQNKGYMKISLQTKNENTNLAKKIIYEQINRLRLFDVEESQIEIAKTSILRSFEMRTDTNKKLLNLITAINNLDLNLNYFEDYMEKVKNVSKSSIKAALNNSMDFDKISVFTVGKTIE